MLHLLLEQKIVPSEGKFSVPITLNPIMIATSVYITVERSTGSSSHLLVLYIILFLQLVRGPAQGAERDELATLEVAINRPVILQTEINAWVARRGRESVCHVTRSMSVQRLRLKYRHQRLQKDLAGVAEALLN